MKKFIILLLTIFLLNVLMVYAGDISIGGTTFRNDVSVIGDRTAINKNNPANADGVITQVNILSRGNLTDVIVFTCQEVSSNTFTSRDYETIGNVASGATRTFNVNIDVKTGDYIGMSFKTENMSSRNDGDGNWYSATGTYINLPFSNQTLNLVTSRNLNLGGTGTTGWGGKFNTVTIGKWNEAEIAKWNTVE